MNPIVEKMKLHLRKTTDVQKRPFRRRRTSPYGHRQGDDQPQSMHHRYRHHRTPRPVTPPRASSAATVTTTNVKVVATATAPMQAVEKSNHEQVDVVVPEPTIRIHDRLQGRYEVRKFLGEGVYSRVYQCLDLKRNQLVAIKVFRDIHSDALTRYSEEKQALCAMNTQRATGVVELLASFRLGAHGHPCLVFELLGDSLREWQSATRSRPEFRSFKWLREVARQLIGVLSLLAHVQTKIEHKTNTDTTKTAIPASSLSYHQIGLVHGDIKPENILFASAGGDTAARTVKLIDFGLVHAVGQWFDPYPQTLWYRSPEVLLRLPYTGAIDMWSVGCVLAEMRTGRPLFPVQSRHRLMYEICSLLQVGPPAHMIESSPKRVRWFRRSNVQRDGYQCRRPARDVNEKEDEEEDRNEKNTDTSTNPRPESEPNSDSDDCSDGEGDGQRPAADRLDDLFRASPPRPGVTVEQAEEERVDFVSLIRQLLEIDPARRLHPDRALRHEFFTRPRGISHSLLPPSTSAAVSSSASSTSTSAPASSSSSSSSSSSASASSSFEKTDIPPLTIRISTQDADTVTYHQQWQPTPTPTPTRPSSPSLLPNAKRLATAGAGNTTDTVRAASTSASTPTALSAPAARSLSSAAALMLATLEKRELLDVRPMSKSRLCGWQWSAAAAHPTTAVMRPTVGPDAMIPNDAQKFTSVH